MPESHDNPRIRKLFPKGLAGIIFDCDGVMIDSVDANRAFYNAALKWLGLPPMTSEQEKFAFMLTSAQALKRIVPESLHDKLDDAQRLGMNYERDVLPRVRLMPGFRNFVEMARARNLRLAIDTNRTRLGMKRVLDFFNLPHYFDPVIACDDVAPKPSPEGVLRICAAWGAKPALALFVGDSESDLLAAKESGCVFCAFGGEIGGDLETDGFAALGETLWPTGGTSARQE